MAYEREYRELSYVPRWGIARIIKKQDVAQHSYYVTLYAMQTCQLFGRQDLVAEAVELALQHDALEAFTTDIASPAKKILVPEGAEDRLERHIFKTRFKGIAPCDRIWKTGVPAIVKFADQLDVVMHLCEEWQLGNRTFGDPALAYYPNTSSADNHPTIAARNCPMLERLFREAVNVTIDPGNENIEDIANHLWIEQVVPRLVEARQGVSHILMPDEDM